MKNIKKILLFVSILVFNVSKVFADTFDLTPYKFDGSGFGSAGDSCAKIAGPNVIKVIHGSITTTRILCVILAIANGMLILIPAVVSKDADGLKKAEKKLVIMGVVLAAIGIFPSIVGIISNIFDFDLSCIM